MVVPVITIVILCVLTGTIISMTGTITEMGNQLSYILDTNSILQSQMGSLQSNIESALEEEASLIEKQEIKVIETDFLSGTYRVKISVVPKEYSDATRVSVFFGVNEIPLTLNRYAYEGVTELNVDDNYDGNVAFLFVNGDKKSTEVVTDYEGLQTKLKDLLYGSIPEIPKYKEGDLYFDQEICYTLNTYEDYGYESLELILMRDDEVVEYMDLLQPATEKNMVYGMSGEKKLKKHIDVKEGQKIRLFLRAQCENGYRLEYDLFSGVIEEKGLNGFGTTEDYFEPNYSIYDADGNRF